MMNKFYDEDIQFVLNEGLEDKFFHIQVNIHFFYLFYYLMDNEYFHKVMPINKFINKFMKKLVK